MPLLCIDVCGHACPCVCVHVDLSKPCVFIDIEFFSNQHLRYFCYISVVYLTAVKPAVTPISVVKSAALKFRVQCIPSIMVNAEKQRIYFRFQNKGIKNSKI